MQIAVALGIRSRDHAESIAGACVGSIPLTVTRRRSLTGQLAPGSQTRGGSGPGWLTKAHLDRSCGAPRPCTYLRDFLSGTFLPARRASERPIAIACLRLVTFLPELPLFSVPRLRSSMAFLTLAPAALLYFLAISLSTCSGARDAHRAADRRGPPTDWQ